MVLNFKASFNAARPQVSLHAPTAKPTVEGHKHCTSRSHLLVLFRIMEKVYGHSFLIEKWDDCKSTFR